MNARRDAMGTEHPLAAADARIVSLVPSITELLCDLGLAPNLVGRTGFCIHPAGLVAVIAKVGGTKDVNIEKIRRLAPTHLVVNIDENEKPTVERLAEFIPSVIVTHPVAPRDNLDLYRLMGGIFGTQGRAEELCAAWLAAESALRPPEAVLKVLYCIWQDPWMTVSADTYIARMLALAGLEQMVLPTPGRYPVFSWSESLVQGLDAVLLSSEPYRFTEAHVEALERQLGKPVILVDGEMMSWYGSRAIAGLRYLEELQRLLQVPLRGPSLQAS